MNQPLYRTLIIDKLDWSEEKSKLLEKITVKKIANTDHKGTLKVWASRTDPRIIFFFSNGTKRAISNSEDLEDFIHGLLSDQKIEYELFLASEADMHEIVHIKSKIDASIKVKKGSRITKKEMEYEIAHRNNTIVLLRKQNIDSGKTIDELVETIDQKSEEILALEERIKLQKQEFDNKFLEFGTENMSEYTEISLKQKIERIKEIGDIENNEEYKNAEEVVRFYKGKNMTRFSKECQNLYSEQLKIYEKFKEQISEKNRLLNEIIDYYKLVLTLPREICEKIFPDCGIKELEEIAVQPDKVSSDLVEHYRELVNIANNKIKEMGYKPKIFHEQLIGTEDFLNCKLFEYALYEVYYDNRDRKENKRILKNKDSICKRVDGFLALHEDPDININFDFYKAYDILLKYNYITTIGERRATQYLFFSEGV